MSDQMQTGFYRQHARYYDAIYHWKDYGADARRVRAILIAEGLADGSRIIDAACGTGNHMVHLRQWYQVEGFDLSPHMIEIAHEKISDARLWEADITSFGAGEPADALVCLFSSIAYVFPEDRLQLAAARCAEAVRPGGVILIEPWIAPEQYISGHHMMHTYDGEDVTLCRMAISGRENRNGVDIAVIDFFWLAMEKGASAAEHFTERHEVWLCSRNVMMKVFEDAGFEVRFEPDGLTRDRGLIIGRRR